MWFKLSGKEQVSRQFWFFNESNTKSNSTFTFFFLFFESLPLKHLFPIVRYLGFGNVCKGTKTSEKFIMIDSLQKCDLIKEKSTFKSKLANTSIKEFAGCYLCIWSGILGRLCKIYRAGSFYILWYVEGGKECGLHINTKATCHIAKPELKIKMGDPSFSQKYLVVHSLPALGSAY